MTEKELEILIQKFLDGTATAKETAYLKKLEKDAEPEVLKNIFKDKRSETETRESIFNQIDRNIGEKPTYPWWKYAAAAAIFIGVLTSGYFFYNNKLAGDTFTIPADAITLEHEDGSIEILKKDGSKALVGKDGKVIGQQKDSKISYEEEKTAKKLVYNTLSVPYGKRFELELSDGTHVHLNAGTSIKYPIAFIRGKPRTVFLTGEAFFDVSKDSLRPFTVNSGTLDVRVLGTRFNVSSYPEDERTDVVLVEGSVGMHNDGETFDTEKSIILLPGYKGTYQKTDGEIHKEPVTTAIYTSWMDGELVFRNMAFENILKKMERHYNVSITNKNTRLGQEVFNASYGNIPLQKVLQDLKLTHGIEYTINGTTITID